MLYVFSGEDIISGQMIHARLLRGAKMVRGSLLKIPKKNIASVLIESCSAQEEGRESDEELLKSICYRRGLLFRKVYGMTQSKRSGQLSSIYICTAT